MAKRTKGPQADELALVEPKSFEELAQRAHEATLNDGNGDGRAPRFLDCFHGGPDHLSCLPLSESLTTLGYLAMGIGVVAWVIGGLAGGMFLPPGHGVVRFFMGTARYVGLGGSAAALFGWLSGYWSWRRNERRCQASATKKLEGPIARHVTAYLGKLIAEEQRRCIGEDSEIERLRKRAEEVLDRARTLKNRLDLRIDEEVRTYHGSGTVPAYITAAHQRTERLVARLTRSRERLSEHRAKLDAFFQECKARVQAAEKPLQDLELVDAVEMLDAEGERLGTEVQEVIIRSTGELYGRLQQLRSTLGVSLAHAGVHLALATPTTSNLERDTSVLEETIARFRPPRIVEGDDAAAPRVQERRQIGIS